jgi:hypothetical protein
MVECTIAAAKGNRIYDDAPDWVVPCYSLHNGQAHVDQEQRKSARDFVHTCISGTPADLESVSNPSDMKRRIGCLDDSQQKELCISCPLNTSLAILSASEKLVLPFFIVNRVSRDLRQSWIGIRSHSIRADEAKLIIETTSSALSSMRLVRNKRTASLNWFHGVPAKIDKSSTVRKNICTGHSIL